MTQKPTRAIARQATSYVTAPGEPPAEGDPLLGFAPYMHSAPRRNSITPDRQRKFIVHLAATGIVTQAAKHIGASMEALYKLRSRAGAEGFASAWDAAVDRGVARLEDGALARAIQGEERLVVSGGQVLGTEVRHNEALVMFFLKNRRKQRYGIDISPGHPLYDNIRRQVEKQVEREANDPEKIRRTRASIDRKVDEFRREFAEHIRQKFNEAVASWCAENPGKVPMLTEEYALVEWKGFSS